MVIADFIIEPDMIDKLTSWIGLPYCDLLSKLFFLLTEYKIFSKILMQNGSNYIHLMYKQFVSQGTCMEKKWTTCKKVPS